MNTYLDDGLTEARRLTREMHQQGERAAQRTEALRGARARGATYAEMAAACGISQVAVYKALRGKDGSARSAE